MMIRNRISLFVATCLIIGFFSLALPEKGYSGVAQISGGCCLDNIATCFGCDGFDCVLSEDACFELGGNPAGGLSVCLALDQGGTFCTNQPSEASGCCLIETANCSNNQTRSECFGEGGNEAEIWYFEESCSNIPRCTPPIVPTLSEWGLIAMAGIIGIVGFMVLRRRKVTA